MDELEPQSSAEPVKGQWQQLKAWAKANPRKAKDLGALVLVLIVGAVLARVFLFPDWPATKEDSYKRANQVFYSPLTGAKTTEELSKRPIRGVIVENSPEARPQSGLSKAGVVYESVSEGGITRFLALFLDETPPVIGPVRSLRLFFMSWGREFGAPISHVGGNASAIDNIHKVGITSLNQFYNAAYYYRSTDRYAPHNVYTTTKLLDKLYKARGLFKPATFTPSPRKEDEPPSSAKAVKYPTINVRFSYALFDVQWKYELASNSYLRFISDGAAKDRNTGKQIKVKNVVVMYMPTSYGTSRNGEHMTVMQTLGKGKAVVFRDGKATVATWKKTSHSARTQLLDANDKNIELNRGHTWYCVIPVGTGSLSY